MICSEIINTNKEGGRTRFIIATPLFFEIFRFVMEGEDLTEEQSNALARFQVKLSN
jgi:hypothetical protein